MHSKAGESLGPYIGEVMRRGDTFVSLVMGSLLIYATLRGAISEALDDLPSPVQSVSVESTPSQQNRTSRQSGDDGDEATRSR